MKQKLSNIDCPEGYYSALIRSKKGDYQICKSRPKKKVFGKGSKKEFLDLFKKAYRNLFKSKKVPKKLVECTYEKYLQNKHLTIERLREYNEKEWEKLIDIAIRACQNYVLPQKPNIKVAIEIVKNLSELALVVLETKPKEYKKINKNINNEIKDIIDEEFIIESEVESNEQFAIRHNREKIKEYDDEIYKILNEPKPNYKKVMELTKERHEFVEHLDKLVKKEEVKKEEVKKEEIKKEEKKEFFDDHSIYIDDITDLIIENLGDQKIKGTFGEFERLFRENYYKIYEFSRLSTRFIYCGYKSYSKSKSLTLNKLQNATEDQWEIFFDKVFELCEKEL